MSSNPDQIREQIEITRGSLSDDVNTLADTVKPGNIARRQAGKVRGVASTAKDRIMGTASDLGSSGNSKISGAGSAVSSAAASSQQAIASAPTLARTQTQGNPLAAGLIAFGAGWLVASLLPASTAEKVAASKAKENAGVVTDELSGIAKDISAHLKEPAQNAASAVQASASDAVGTVRAEGTSAAADVKDQGVEAAHSVKDSRE